MITETLAGVTYEPHTMKYLWAEVADAGAAFARWNVNGPTLVSRLRALTPAQQFAIADAVERYWNGTTTLTTERLFEVGLLHR